MFVCFLVLTCRLLTFFFPQPWFAARSPVFNAMFEHKMEESKKVSGEKFNGLKSSALIGALGPEELFFSYSS